MHVERQIVQAAFITCQWSMRIIIKLYKRVYIVPYKFIVGVKDMRSIFVYIYAFNFFAINIPSGMPSFVYDQALFTCISHLPGKNSAIQTCADNTKIK